MSSPPGTYHDGDIMVPLLHTRTWECLGQSDGGRASSGNKRTLVFCRVVCQTEILTKCQHEVEGFSRPHHREVTAVVHGGFLKSKSGQQDKNFPLTRCLSIFPNETQLPKHLEVIIENNVGFSDRLHWTTSAWSFALISFFFEEASQRESFYMRKPCRNRRFFYTTLK